MGRIQTERGRGDEEDEENLALSFLAAEAKRETYCTYGPKVRRVYI